MQIPGGVTAAKGYRASGMYAAVRAGKKRDLALVVSETDAVSAGEPGRQLTEPSLQKAWSLRNVHSLVQFRNSGSL